MAKDAIFTVKLESELRDAFVAEAKAVDRPASQLVREFMRGFVEHQRQEREHDAWFRDQVQEALDDRKPGVAHDEVMAQMRASRSTIRSRRLPSATRSTVRSRG